MQSSGVFAHAIQRFSLLYTYAGCLSIIIAILAVKRLVEVTLLISLAIIFHSLAMVIFILPVKGLVEVTFLDIQDSFSSILQPLSALNMNGPSMKHKWIKDGM